MATKKITESNKWAILAIIALILIILMLWGVGGSMSSSKDSEMQKLTTAITTQTRTIDNIDGAVKKIPRQLRDAIIDHENRMHSKKPATVNCCLPRKQRVKPIRRLPEVQKQKPQPVDKVAIVSSALQDCNSFGGVLVLREGKIVCDIKKADTPPAEKVAQPTPLQEGAECDAGKGHTGILKIVDGKSRCVWEVAHAPLQQRREQSQVRETVYYREPLREVYYEDEPQEEASSSGFGSWLPWVAAAVVGGIIYNNSRRNNTVPIAAVVGGPVNPMPGGPVNPVP